MTVETFFDNQVDLYRDAYGQSPDFQARWAVWAGLIEQLRFASCLDVGCGAGIFSFFVAERGIPTTGVDVSSRMVEACRAEASRRGLTNARFQQGSLPLTRELGLGCFDLVVCSSVLEYVEPIDEAIASLAAATSPGGHLLVSFPNAQSWFRKYERLRYRVVGRPSYYQHVRRLFTAPEVAARFARLGCSLLETHYYGDEPLLSRLGARVAPRFGKNLFVSVFHKPRDSR